MNHKIIMIVCSRFQLLEAFHLRRKKFSCDNVSVVLYSGQFDPSYCERLKGFFSDVYYIDDSFFTKRKKCVCFFLPGRVLREVGIDSPRSYTDIFFYNPGWLFYTFRKFQACRGINYHWHIIQDAQSNYVIENDNDYGRFIGYNHSIIHRIMKLIDCSFFNIDLKGEFDDEYLWCPELKIIKCDHRIHKIERIDVTEDGYLDEINYIFAFSLKDHIIKDDYIYIDTSYGFFDDLLTARIILDLTAKIKNQSIGFLLHPGGKKEDYIEVDNCVHFIYNTVPWELLCLNGLARDKIIIGTLTSALFLPLIISNSEIPVVYSFINKIDLRNVKIQGCIEVVEQSRVLYERVEKIDRRFRRVQDINDIRFI